MIYSKVIVFYFSGTGNAKTAAEWIIANARKQDIDTELIDIADNKIFVSNEYGADTLIGFCYPTHGFNLSGSALFLPALILRIRGYKVKAYRPLDLPSNWISIHPGLRKKVTLSIFKRCKRIIDSFSEKLFSGKRVYRGLLDLPIDIAISPIALGYYFYGRFVIAKTFYASHDCNNCGLCIKNCPVKAIELVDNRPFWTFSCESCMQCMNNCPKRAIETAHSYTFLIWWLAFSFVPYSLIKLLVKYELINVLWINSHFNLLFYLFMTVFGFIIFYFGYRVFHFLLRFRFFNLLITYSSLTKYKFWRRYKAPEL